MPRKLKSVCAAPCLVITLLIASALLPATARGQSASSETDARALMEQGAAHYEQQDWEAARQSFRRAWELEKHPAIASNLAEVEMNLGRYVEAAEHLKFVLQALPEAVSEKRTIVEQQLAECRARILSVRINVSVAGAEIHLDGWRVGISPLADEVLVAPGTHVIEASLPGFRPARSHVSGAPGAIAHVDLRLALQVRNHTPRTMLRPTPQREPESGASASRNVVLYGASGLALVAAGVGAFYWAQSRSSAGDARELRAQARSEGAPNLVAQNAQCSPPEARRPPVCGPLRDKVDEQYRQRSIATGAFIGAGILASGAVLTYLFWTDDTRVGADPRALVGGWASSEGAGLEVRGNL